jgi:CubicO group peptidase (beta-lactamase class C family)
MVNFYSVGKAIVSLLALQLVDQERVNLDAPIATVWPEFAQGGKDAADGPWCRRMNERGVATM